MKSVLDKVTRDELIGRIGHLNENSTAQWGKMNLGQMLEHCVRAEELYLGKIHMKRTLPGLLFGKMAIKNLLKDETPMGRNLPTRKEFVITAGGQNIHNEMLKWIGLINEYGNFPDHVFVHWFFGPMTREQVGYFVYKHADHHLRQFNS